MTHYQKLATLIFRVIGVVFFVMGGIAAVAALIFTFVEARIAFLIAVFYAFPTLVFGILFFSLSSKLAKWVCFDFNNFNER